METEQIYLVEITPEAEKYYWNLLEYLYTTHDYESASVKSDEIIMMTMSLDKMPYRGSDEPVLAYLEKGHKYLVYQVTSRKSIKIIYFVDEESRTVYVTDFFPTEKDGNEVSKRNR